MPSRASSLSNSRCCSSRSSASPSEKLISRPGLHGALDVADRLAGAVRRRELPRVVEQRVAKAPAVQLGLAPDLIDQAELARLFERQQRAGRPSTRSPWPCRPAAPAAACRRCRASTPSATSGRPIFPPPCRAMRMSAAIATSRPPPTVWPLSPAITSFGVCSSRFIVSLACRQK